jgi:hypothetical protein
VEIGDVRAYTFPLKVEMEWIEKGKDVNYT